MKNYTNLNYYSSDFWHCKYFAEYKGGESYGYEEKKFTHYSKPRLEITYYLR